MIEARACVDSFVGYQWDSVSDSDGPMRVSSHLISEGQTATDADERHTAR